MKRIAICTFLLCLALTFMDSFPVFGQESPNYVAVKAGIYSPTSDLDDFDTGFTGFDFSWHAFYNCQCNQQSSDPFSEYNWNLQIS